MKQMLEGGKKSRDLQQRSKKKKKYTHKEKQKDFLMENQQRHWSLLQVFVEELDEPLEAERTGIFVEVGWHAVREGMFATRVGVELVVHLSRFQFLLQRLLRWGVWEPCHLENKHKAGSGA